VPHRHALDAHSVLIEARVVSLLKSGITSARQSRRKMAEQIGRLASANEFQLLTPVYAGR
jgi:hypothetical protein